MRPTLLPTSKPPPMRGMPLMNVHHARQVRSRADWHHARALHAIATRARPPDGQAPREEGEMYDVFAKSLQMRKAQERSFREFERQKENLLLLQRLQQIHFYEHPNYRSHNAQGKNYAAEWAEHRKKHEEVRARLATRPRISSSLNFAQLNEESPLSPRNRVAWEGKNRQVLWKEYRDTTLDKDPVEPSKFLKSGATPATQVEANRMRRERHKIEAELQRRWSEFDRRNPAGDSEYGDSDGESLGAELGLGPDLEDESIESYLRMHSNNGFAASNSQQSSTVSLPLRLPAPPPAKAHHRAHYIDPDEDDLEFEDDEQPTITTSSSLRSLYKSVTRPQADGAGEFESNSYRSQPPYATAASPQHYLAEQGGDYAALGSPPQSTDQLHPQPAPYAGSYYDADSLHITNEIDDVLAVLNDIDDAGPFVTESDVIHNKKPTRPTSGRRRNESGRGGRPDQPLKERSRSRSRSQSASSRPPAARPRSHSRSKTTTTQAEASARYDSYSSQYNDADELEAERYLAELSQQFPHSRLGTSQNAVEPRPSSASKSTRSTSKSPRHHHPKSPSAGGGGALSSTSKSPRQQQQLQWDDSPRTPKSTSSSHASIIEAIGPSILIHPNLSDRSARGHDRDRHTRIVRHADGDDEVNQRTKSKQRLKTIRPQ